jgi:hypothetical protein
MFITMSDFITLGNNVNRAKLLILLITNTNFVNCSKKLDDTIMTELLNLPIQIKIYSEADQKVQNQAKCHSERSEESRNLANSKHPGFLASSE